MDLRTTYLGLDLPHPFIIGSSPLTNRVDSLRACVDAGASALVVHSLFEEQINGLDNLEPQGPCSAEALNYFPRAEAFPSDPDNYLEAVKRAKDITDLPIIASLNGANPGVWVSYAQQLADAGADALELAIYHIATDPRISGATIEQAVIDLAAQAKMAAGIPLSVKLSPVYSSLPHLAGSLRDVGVNGLVLFNRYFHPDINVERLEVERRLTLTNPTDLFLRLRALAILSACDDPMDLAISGGVNCGLDATKAIMCGADAIQLVSAVLVNGPSRLAEIRSELETWMEDHDYDSLQQMKDSMNLRHCPDASSFERANYVHIIQEWDAGHRELPSPS